MALKHQFGKNRIVYGTMASGKSIELIRYLHVYKKFAKKFEYDIHIFKPALDTRRIVESQSFLSISSRVAGLEFTTHVNAVNSSREIIDYFKDRPEGRHVIAIDEVQMFDSGIIGAIRMLSGPNNHVVIAGLDKSFRGEPFPLSDFIATMEDVIDLFDPECRVHLKAVCEVCGDEAEYVQRLLNHNPAPYHDPLIVIGDKNIGEGADVRSYEPRCKKHFEIPYKDEFLVVKHLLEMGVPEEEISRIIPPAGIIIERIRSEQPSLQLKLI